MSNAPVPETAQLRAQWTQWNDWLSRHTDELLSLEERCRTAASQRDRDDVAAAFVARKAIADRLVAVGAAIDQNKRADAVALTRQAITDELGGPVGANLDDAAKLLDAIIGSVSTRIATAEQEQAVVAGQTTSIDADLAVASTLAETLGTQTKYAAQLRVQREARRDLAGLATAAAQLRSSLEASDRERQRILASFAEATDRLQRLTALEAEVRAAAERCRAKVLHAPQLAVPSVAAIGDPPPASALRGLTWQSARALVEPYVTRVDRLERALHEARRRFTAPLAERDDLRGLLQGFRSKAGANGFAEDPQIEPMYRRAQELLWQAPCDLEQARPLVSEYVAAVNERASSRVRTSMADKPAARSSDQPADQPRQR